MNPEKLIKFIDKKEGEKEYINKQLNEIKKEIKQLKIKQKRAEQALTFIKKIALDTQRGLEIHISDTISAALEAVFDDPYEFETEFVERRGKTECDLFFETNGNRIHPFTASGIGAVDIATLGLRTLSIAMKIDCPNLLIADEPMKHLSLNYHEEAGELLKTISSQLGMQMIIISHSPEFSNYADKVFTVKKKNNQSVIKEAI